MADSLIGQAGGGEIFGQDQGLTGPQGGQLVRVFSQQGAQPPAVSLYVGAVPRCADLNPLPPVTPPQGTGAQGKHFTQLGQSIGEIGTTMFGQQMPDSINQPGPRRFMFPLLRARLSLQEVELLLQALNLGFQGRPGRDRGVVIVRHDIVFREGPLAGKLRFYRLTGDEDMQRPKPMDA